MLYKLIALSVVFGLVVADPVAKLSSLSDDGLDSYSPSFIEESKTFDVVAVDKPSLILDAITTLIGYKASALTLAVKVIGWVVSNCIFIALGAIATLGFCKLTDKCSLSYDKFSPIPVPLRSLVTSEQLENAEKFFFEAVEKYAQERNEGALKKML